MKRLFIILLSLIGFIFAQNQYPEFPTFPDYLYIPETQEAQYTYQAESLALFARMTTPPDETRKQLIDGLIADFKNESLWELGAFWDGMDAIWSFAAHAQTAAPLNWIEDDHNCGEVNSPSFEVDRGYTGNGSTSYLNSNYNPASEAVNFSQNDASAGAYIRAGTGGNKAALGLTGVTNAGTIVIFVSNTGNAIAVNITSSSAATEAVVSPLGFTSVSRLASSSFIIYKNGASLSTESTNSNALTDGNMDVLARNFVGFFHDSFSDQTISFAFIGRGLTDNEQTTLFTLTETYLAAIGAGVM